MAKITIQDLAKLCIISGDTPVLIYGTDCVVIYEGKFKYCSYIYPSTDTPPIEIEDITPAVYSPLGGGSKPTGYLCITLTVEGGYNE